MMGIINMASDSKKSTKVSRGSDDNYSCFNCSINPMALISKQREGS